MENGTKSPIEKPDAKEWFEGGYEPRPTIPPNVHYASFGKPPPPREPNDDDQGGEVGEVR
jgi:hypothetical protein